MCYEVYNMLYIYRNAKQTQKQDVKIFERNGRRLLSTKQNHLAHDNCDARGKPPIALITRIERDKKQID